MTAACLPNHASLRAVSQMGPPPAGNLAIPVFVTDALGVQFYAPHGVDPQMPRERDEVYAVATGSGQFFDGER